MTESTKTVATIIVNWNGLTHTLDCLKSLSGIETSGLHHIIIVVDNGSSDGSVEMIPKKFPHVIFLKNSENLGFTGGNNVGIAEAQKRGAYYIWLLNNDTIVDKHALIQLVRYCDSHRAVGIAGSKIYFAKGSEFHKARYTKDELGQVIWYAGGIVDWQNMYAAHRGVDQVDRGQFATPAQTDFITGCSMFIRREVLEKIGVFDNRFYLYLEDVDLSLRAKRFGYDITYVPTSVIWHKNAGSTGRPGHSLHQYYFTRNRFLIGMKYAPIRTKLALVRQSFSFLLRGTQAEKQAVVDYVCGRFGNRFIWKKS